MWCAITDCDIKRTVVAFLSTWYRLPVPLARLPASFARPDRAAGGTLKISNGDLLLTPRLNPVSFTPCTRYSPVRLALLALGEGVSLVLPK